MSSKLTALQVKQLNAKINQMIPEFHAVLHKHGFSDLVINQLHLQPKDAIKSCPEGQVSITVLDEHGVGTNTCIPTPNLI